MKEGDVKYFERQDLVHQAPFGYVRVVAGKDKITTSTQTISQSYKSNISAGELEDIITAALDATKDLPTGWKQTYAFNEQQ